MTGPIRLQYVRTPQGCAMLEARDRGCSARAEWLRFPFRPVGVGGGSPLWPSLLTRHREKRQGDASKKGEALLSPPLSSSLPFPQFSFPFFSSRGGDLEEKVYSPDSCSRSCGFDNGAARQFHHPPPKVLSRFN